MPTSGPGTTSIRSSATRIRPCSTAGRSSRPGRARPSRRASACWSGPTRSAIPASWPRWRRPSTTPATGGRSSASAPAWMEPEFRAHGIDFGASFGERLDWLDESVGAMRRLFDGEPVTSPAGRALRVRRPAPEPASGPDAPADHDRRQRREEDAPDRRALRRHVERDRARSRRWRTRSRSFKGHCDAVGRDIAEIEFTLGGKLTIRDTEAEADRVWKAAIAHNQTPQAERRRRHVLLAGHAGADRRPAATVRRARLPDDHLRAARAVRRRDVRAVHRRGRAAPRLTQRDPDGTPSRVRIVEVRRESPSGADGVPQSAATSEPHGGPAPLSRDAGGSRRRS